MLNKKEKIQNLRDQKKWIILSDCKQWENFFNGEIHSTLKAIRVLQCEINLVEARYQYDDDDTFPEGDIYQEKT